MAAAALPLRLSSQQMLLALDGFDLLDLLAGRLAGGEHGLDRTVPLATGNPAARQTVVEDWVTGTCCLLPLGPLRMIWAAGLAVLASRELVTPGVLTAAVFGSGTLLWLQAEIMVRYLPGLSHIALSGAIGDPPMPVPQRLLDQFELAGVGLSIVDSPRRAALGANLLVLTVSGPPGLEIGLPSAGALMINAAGRDLPDQTIACADRIFVDFLGLLRDNRHRGFLGPAAPGSGPARQPLLAQREGWYRRKEPGHSGRHVAADLGQVLTGASPGRTSDEEILLVELLGTDAVDAALARRLCQSAVEHGLGARSGPVDERHGDRRRHSGGTDGSWNW